jgi:hypothetical protein
VNDQLINISFKTHRRGRVELLKYFIGDLLKNPYNTYFIIAKNLIFSRLAIIHVRFVDAKSALNANHTASRTKLASHA